MMNACIPLICVGPDDLFLSIHFEQFCLTRFCVIGGDHGVSVRQPLSSAGVIKWF